jgi:hypothetical protein
VTMRDVATPLEAIGDLSSGLPDGLFSNQKVPVWVNFGGP